jgi:hAT family C-terminal dimerisation region
LEFLLFALQGYNPITNAITVFKDLLTVELQAENEKILQNQVLQLSMFLDPRFKNNFPRDVGKRAIIVDNVKAILREKEQEEPAVNPPPKKKSKLCTFKDVVNSRSNTTGSESSRIHREIREYLSMPVASLEENPLEFWDSSGDAFPLLKNLASTYLITTASSTASERIVSALNFVLAKRRSRLTSENVEMLVFLKCLDEKIWERVLV